MTKFLVTGGTGQVGAYVCSSLLDAGHDVTIYDYSPNLGSIANLRDRVEVVPGDVLDFEEILNVTKTRGIKRIIHLAALLVLDSKTRPSKALRVNCVGTNNVFEAARILDLENVVFTSSVAVYGPPSYYPALKVTEDDFPHCPSDPYSVTKFVNESMSRYYRESYGLDLLCLRLTGAWGPGRYSGYTGQFNDFIRRVSIGEEAKLPTDFAYRGAKLRWFYIKEMASCITYVSATNKIARRRGLYNVGTKSPFRALDLVDAIKKWLPDANINYSEVSEPSKLSMDVAGPSGLDVDCSKLYDELGFKEKMGMAESVRDMIDHERRAANLACV